MDVFQSTMHGVYVHVQNIIAKLHGERSDVALMLNCHFDTAPESAG